ncbi:RpiB/LacA/LacB family sugar-phosphate isomerase [Shouchella clausii]
MKIGFGADHNAFHFKEELLAYVKELGYEVVDFGAYSEEDIDYPNIAFQVAKAIKDKVIDRGILCCGTGIGMAIAANKVSGIRAAQIFESYGAQRAQLSNNAQVITFGAFVQGIASAKELAKEYLANGFQSGTGSERKINQICQYEQQTHGE